MLVYRGTIIYFVGETRHRFNVLTSNTSLVKIVNDKENQSTAGAGGLGIIRGNKVLGESE